MPDVSLIEIIIVLSLVTYRVTRFLLLDSLIEVTRDRVYTWLETHPNRFTMKLVELIRCPYCITIWVAAGAVVATIMFTDASVPMPVFAWLAVAAASLVWWRIIDPKD